MSGRVDQFKNTDAQGGCQWEILREMAEHGIIQPVTGHGKGKYRFRGLDIWKEEN